MSPVLAYWVAVAALGLLAALGSLTVGLRYYGYLRRQRPELLGGYWPEIVRDALLVVALTGNLMVGLEALYGPLRSGLGLIAILVAATCLSLFAIFNFVLRVGR